MNDSNINSKQKEYNDLMELIRKSYSEETLPKAEGTDKFRTWRNRMALS